MLTPGAQLSGDGALAARVLEIVAETTGVAREELCVGMPLAAALDSLTLAAVVARAEAALGFALERSDAVEVLAARDIGELCRLIAAAAARAHANLPEEPRNGGCRASGGALE
jgi:acyl carrier protein